MDEEKTYLRLENVTKRFGGLRAVNNLSFSLKRGRVTSLIGPNGAGKTTTFNLSTGFFRPDEGRVYFKSKDITGSAPHELVGMGLARTFQDLRLFNRLTALDNVLMGMQSRCGESLWEAVVAARRIKERKKRDIERGMSLLESVGLSEKAEECAADLSYGQQKLLALARLMASNVELLMLDEPASGLPLGNVDDILQVIKDLVGKGKTALVIEHNMEAVMEVSDWIIVLSFGEVIASGTPKEIQENEEVIKVYLGT
jgi:ABC-type branched-subunit amino acid transport system ATPase component